MSNFSNLKRTSSLDALKKQVEKLTQSTESTSREDDRFWNPSVDKAGNGMAIVRFLPAPAVDGDDGTAFVQVFSHGFQGAGGWLIDDCLTTIGQKCPVCEYNSKLWNSGIETDKEIVRKQKRKLHYIANVYIVSDPSNPENEGQVKLFKFGKKIFDKLNEAMSPEFPDEEPMNPFDFWSGANFKLKMRKVDGYRNYDKSEFESPSALFDGDDDQLEKLWKKEYSLKDFTNPENFKSYDQIKQRLDKVIGVSGSVAERVSTNSRKQDSDDDYVPPAPTQKKQASVSTEEDEDLDYFKSLAED